ncbi:sterile alpha motif domain-containing protein 9-like isoform X1 [Neoarius graeffei]|uniref:sterile alpha motif domain-containing protein 9-like isoform X1 n=1 Tax=Neoarius graeffei TaxID=443677 RepID=UPI00298CD2F7|nr:sterile alpha motif domain-containing protein 9-like isoform X1 [Neoarius graeffei]XP_060757329.1 sterile alpha motif domain-containing protein 9-like isoform X1 [Neoarius graeffei]
MEDLKSTPVEKWTESMVSKWLTSIGVKETYVKKLNEEEVDGRVLIEITEDFLKNETGMKSGQAHLIIAQRNKLVSTVQKAQKQKDNAHERTAKNDDQGATSIKTNSITSSPQKGEDKEDSVIVPTTKRDSKPRSFGKEGIDYMYVKHNVLYPETGVIDLITPCHEYKAFTTAANLDRQRLQAKLAREVLKFAMGCVNIRSNGTIHFGIMDSKENSGHVHGEIIGIPIKEKDMYVDALDHIERSFKLTSDRDLVRQCIRPPEFIRVFDPNSKVERYVVEFDIVPSVSIVRNRVFSVQLPNFKEKTNKVEFEKETIYRRVGSKTEPVLEASEFYQAVHIRDAQREKAEQAHSFTGPGLCQDLGRKLIMLVTSGKKLMEKEKWYILVTNTFSKEDLKHIDFLLNMKLFCVFDFDPDSMVSGLCHEYVKHHAVNLHFMHDYKKSNDVSIREFENHLHLFEQISWIFCNGRSDFKGNELPCDENTWSKTRRTFLKDCVAWICKDILPKGTFLVIFLLTSPVETPLLNTFYEFFTDMEGHEDIICISESAENFKKWQAFALGSCDNETVNTSSVVGMKISHINATLQSIQTNTTRTTKHLAVYVKGECRLETCEEERMCSLEILGVNQCEDSSLEYIESEKEKIEREFYLGGKVTWMNFWLAEKNFVGEMIQRDAYSEVTRRLGDILKWSLDQMPIDNINIYHHPGSGGSTVARQVLWNQRKELRCAVVKPSYSAGTVAEHAVKLREYEEKDPQKCLPVLLLIEDCDKEYLEDLKNELGVAVYTKKIGQGIPCFILLSCRRSHTPEDLCKGSPLLNVSVTHKLSAEEKRKFAGKRKKLEQCFQPEFILTFILMSEEFERQTIAKYVEKFVLHLLQDIDHATVVTQLIRYVALLNTYVQNSFISQSHCEALLDLSIRVDRFQQHAFEHSLSEQAKLVFIHLRDERTNIKSIRIIHPLVAKEILHQLLGHHQQSDLALALLHDEVLFEHRFGRDEYMTILRALFMRRCRISKGDESDSFFSPLIERVREKETPEKAIELLNEAYKRFNKDALFAQQLARLCCRHERFEEAERWAYIAANKMPNNSYILDTKGQVYRRWFTKKCKAIDEIRKTANNTADAIETALKAIECFQECAKAAVADTESMNNAGSFAVVEVGCGLLKLISSLRVFSNKTDGHSECLKYLLTDYIPKDVEKPWEHFHCQLKRLQGTMRAALEWISEDLSYFQTDLNTDEDETSISCEMTVIHPKHWLVTKSSVYGKFFSEASLSTVPTHLPSNPATLTPFTKRMIICKLGGGNFTTIFSILDQKDKVKILEDIISLYPKNPVGAKMCQEELVNYIASHFALSAVSDTSPRLAALSDLQKLSNLFPHDLSRCLSSALFLYIILFWPEEHDPEKEYKFEKILSALEFLQRTYWTRMKDIPHRRRRIYTHFFLGNGVGYGKFVHKSQIENITKLSSVSERRMKWFRGELWKAPEIAGVLKRVTGWTENGNVYLEGPKMKKFPVHALYIHSVPHGNENVTFYLGFTFRGPVAYNVTVKNE